MSGPDGCRGQADYLITVIFPNLCCREEHMLLAAADLNKLGKGRAAFLTAEKITPLVSNIRMVLPNGKVLKAHLI